MADTFNQQLFDAMVRHQIGLLQFSGGVRNKVWKLLDATEADVRQQILERLRLDVGKPMTPARLQRMNALLASLKETRLSAWKGVEKTWLDEMKGLALAEPGFMADTLTGIYPVDLGLELPDAARLRAIVTHNPFLGATLKQWSKGEAKGDIDRIHQQIKIGMAQGEDVQQLARRVVGSLGAQGADGVTAMTRRNAEAITRTATNGIANMSRREFFDANADLMTGELFTATLDSRTTPICQSLDGKIFPIGEGPNPPLHWQCRSVRSPIVDGEVIGDRPVRNFTEKQLLREYADKNGFKAPATRDGLPRGTKGDYDAFARKRMRELTGTVPAKTSYQEWLKGQPPQFQDDILGPARGKLFREGGLTLDKFVSPSGKTLTLKELGEFNSKAMSKAGVVPPAAAGTVAGQAPPVNALEAAVQADTAAAKAAGQAAGEAAQAAAVAAAEKATQAAAQVAAQASAQQAAQAAAQAAQAAQAALQAKTAKAAKAAAAEAKAAAKTAKAAELATKEAQAVAAAEAKAQAELAGKVAADAAAVQAADDTVAIKALDDDIPVHLTAKQKLVDSLGEELEAASTGSVKFTNLEKKLSDAQKDLEDSIKKSGLKGINVPAAKFNMASDELKVLTEQWSNAKFGSPAQKAIESKLRFAKKKLTVALDSLPAPDIDTSVAAHLPMPTTTVPTSPAITSTATIAKSVRMEIDNQIDDLHSAIGNIEKEKWNRTLTAKETRAIAEARKRVEELIAGNLESKFEFDAKLVEEVLGVKTPKTHVVNETVDYTTWVRSLSKAEREAIRQWTGSSYKQMRQAQLGNAVVDQRFHTMFKNMTQALERAPKRHVRAFRGFGMPKEEFEALVVGDTGAGGWKLSANSSFSEKRMTARGFMRGAHDDKFVNVLTEVRMKSAGPNFDDYDLTGNRGENEVVALKGTRFKLLSKTQRGEAWYLVFEEI